MHRPHGYIGASMMAAASMAAMASPTLPGPSAKQIEQSKLGWDENVRYHGSRGRQAKPRKRPNMNHVSRRTKRRHRRAA